jgi:hypothetical protein
VFPRYDNETMTKESVASAIVGGSCPVLGVAPKPKGASCRLPGCSASLRIVTGVMAVFLRCHRCHKIGLANPRVGTSATPGRQEPVAVQRWFWAIYGGNNHVEVRSPRCAPRCGSDRVGNGGIVR